MIQFEEPAQVLSNPPSKMSEVNGKQTKVQQRYNVRYVEA